MDKGKLETQRDLAATDALRARNRIETAVDNGELPRWVLETCEAWERSTLAYGSAVAQLAKPAAFTLAADHRLH